MRSVRRFPTNNSSKHFDDVPLIAYHRLPQADEVDSDTNSGDHTSVTIMPRSRSPTTSWNEDQYLVAENRRRRQNCCSKAVQGCMNSLGSCIANVFSLCCRRKELQSRELLLGRLPDNVAAYPSNAVRNQKYNLITFVPFVLFNQFKFFLNLYFLVMALSQFVPDIKIGYISTYWGPLGFVMFVTMCREAYDDFMRYRRDKEMNSKKYERFTGARGGWQKVASSQLRVGDIVHVHKDERVPADLLLLRTTERTGSCFIRTDQLDGETDWKLRIAVPATQQLESADDLTMLDASVYAEKPQKDIYDFVGTFRRHGMAMTQLEEGSMDQTLGLTVDNTLWADTVVASGTATGLVIYTGHETRSAMNASQPQSKVGLLDLEMNNLTKILCLVVVALSFVMVFLKGFDGPWYRYLFRFILLFSYIIPISLRVNLDMAKITYAWLVGRDKLIPGTVVRSSTIPEELGRIGYLLTDKTGTLTMNQMIFKKLHIGSTGYGTDSFETIKDYVRSQSDSSAADQNATSVSRQNVVEKTFQAIHAIALCHNVTPIVDDADTFSIGDSDSEPEVDQRRTNRGAPEEIQYQASSPDEVALVSWTEDIGLTLVHRDITSMRLRTPSGRVLRYQILEMFPFSSASKRMGIIIKDEQTDEISLYMKGADAVMKSMVQYNDWMEEECTNMAREGLRTLVVARKTLTTEQYKEFADQYAAARSCVSDRADRMAAVLGRIEKDLQLLCVTGVEDMLQTDVRSTLETMANAGIKVWMLTGDKQETAICIAKSSRLISRTQPIHVFRPVLNRAEAHAELGALRRKTDVALIITGDSLKMCLENYEDDFAELACGCTAVVCCRCSPEQKAQIVQVLMKYLPSRKRIAAVGDGGNDVGMIQAAHAGIGIVGKEGKQASLAADFSITQFSFLCRLLLCHGRYTYKRSCALGQFVMHRGLIISTMQAIFSCIFYFASVSLYQGMLMVLYSTVYTMMPVFSIVLDKDVRDEVAMKYPELYKDLQKGRSLSYKTFFIWFLASVYQGAIIMYGALILFENDMIHIVSISFTALIITELIMVGLTIHTWHYLMIVAETLSLCIYVLSLLFLPMFFDVEFVRTGDFIWKTVVITLVSCLPLYIYKFVQKRVSPAMHEKLNE